MNKISVVSLEKKFKRFEKNVRIIAERLLKILSKENLEVEIYLAGSRKMRFLNKKFRGQDKPADVLSFEEPRCFVHPPPAVGAKFRKMGEIYLNMSKVKSQKSMVYLLIHGLLHLFGYEHQKKNDRIRMEKTEQYILANIHEFGHEFHK